MNEKEIYKNMANGQKQKKIEFIIAVEKLNLKNFEAALKEGATDKELEKVYREAGPALACTYNKNTEKYYYYINNIFGYQPKLQHPLLIDRFKYMEKYGEEIYNATYGAGSHAECYATNESLIDQTAIYIYNKNSDVDYNTIYKDYKKIEEKYSKEIEGYVLLDDTEKYFELKEKILIEKLTQSEIANFEEYANFVDMKSNLKSKQLEKALDEMKKDGQEIKLSDTYLSVINLEETSPYRNDVGVAMHRCPHCKYITDGVTLVPELEIEELKNQISEKMEKVSINYAKTLDLKENEQVAFYLNIDEQKMYYGREEILKAPNEISKEILDKNDKIPQELKEKLLKEKTQNKKEMYMTGTISACNNYYLQNEAMSILPEELKESLEEIKITEMTKSYATIMGINNYLNKVEDKSINEHIIEILSEDKEKEIPLKGAEYITVVEKTGEEKYKICARDAYSRIITSDKEITNMVKNEEYKECKANVEEIIKDSFWKDNNKEDYKKQTVAIYNKSNNSYYRLSSKENVIHPKIKEEVKKYNKGVENNEKIDINNLNVELEAMNDVLVKATALRMGKRIVKQEEVEQVYEKYKESFDKIEIPKKVMYPYIEHPILKERLDEYNKKNINDMISSLTDKRVGLVSRALNDSLVAQIVQYTRENYGYITPENIEKAYKDCKKINRVEDNVAFAYKEHTNKKEMVISVKVEKEIDKCLTRGTAKCNKKEKKVNETKREIQKYKQMVQESLKNNCQEKSMTSNKIIKENKNIGTHSHDYGR